MLDRRASNFYFLPISKSFKNFPDTLFRKYTNVFFSMSTVNLKNKSISYFLGKMGLFGKSKELPSRTSKLWQERLAGMPNKEVYSFMEERGKLKKEGRKSAVINKKSI